MNFQPVVVERRWPVIYWCHKPTDWRAVIISLPLN